MSVVPSTVESMFLSSQELLVVAEQALAGTDAGVPERTYVAPSEPAFDCCPFLTVHVAGLTEDTTGAGPGGVATGHRTMRGSIPLVSYVVLAIRCAVVVTNGVPTPDALEGVAEQVQQDGWALWNRLRQAIRDEEIFGLCSEVYFDGGVSVIEQGGCVGWRFTIRAALPGFGMEFAS